MTMTATHSDVASYVDVGRDDGATLLAAAEPRPEERHRARLTALMERTTRRRCAGALLSALSSGLLSGDPDQTEALFQLATDLDGDALVRRRALSSLMTLARLGEPGALSVLAWLGDEPSADALATVARTPGRRTSLRVAAVRGALFVLRVPGAPGTAGGTLLSRALVDATDDDDAAVRYTAAYVRAALGQRAVRGCLERGALEETDPDLLRLCLLGIEAVGDATSLPFVWRVWMRQASLRDLADAVSERLEEDLRRRQVNILEGARRPEGEAAPDDGALEPVEVVVEAPPNACAVAADGGALPEVVVH